MKLIEQIISNSEQDTEELAARIAASLPDGGVILLDGDLGAGKTVFARGFAQALKITEPVSSPTYTIVQEYDLPERRGWLFHLDLYRINDSRSALGFGVDEFLNEPGSYALVEWPERIADILNGPCYKVAIKHLDENRREISWYSNQ